MFKKIRNSLSPKKDSPKDSLKKLIVKQRRDSLNFDYMLPKINIDYKLDFNLYNIDRLIDEIFTDLQMENELNYLR